LKIEDCGLRSFDWGLADWQAAPTQRFNAQSIDSLPIRDQSKIGNQQSQSAIGNRQFPIFSLQSAVCNL
jgi:hypothetical protein